MFGPPFHSDTRRSWWATLPYTPGPLAREPGMSHWQGWGAGGLWDCAGITCSAPSSLTRLSCKPHAALSCNRGHQPSLGSLLQLGLERFLAQGQLWSSEKLGPQGLPLVIGAAGCPLPDTHVPSQQLGSCLFHSQSPPASSPHTPVLAHQPCGAGAVPASQTSEWSAGHRSLALFYRQGNNAQQEAREHVLPAPTCNASPQYTLLGAPGGAERGWPSACSPLPVVLVHQVATDGKYRQVLSSGSPRTEAWEGPLRLWVGPL